MKKTSILIGVMLAAIAANLSYGQVVWNNSTYVPTKPVNYDVHAMVPNLPRSSSSRVDGSLSVCGKVGFAGVNAKGCIGTSGISTSVSYGVGVSGGITERTGWDGKKSTCLIGSASGGAGPMVTGGGGICRNQNGRPYGTANIGGGIGAGVEGVQSGVTVEYTHNFR